MTNLWQISVLSVTLCLGVGVEAARGASSQVIPRDAQNFDDAQWYSVELPTGKYSFKRDGQVRQSGAQDTVEKKLELEDDFEIVHLFVVPFEDDLVIQFVQSNFLEGAGQVVRLDGKTLAVKWTAPGPVMNIAPPIVCGDSLCVAGHGSVASIGLSTGSITWSHFDLYERYQGFNVVGSLSIQGDRLVVKESRQPRVSHTHRNSMTLYVDLKTGTYTVQ